MAVVFDRESGERIIRGIRTVEGDNAYTVPPPRNPRRPRGGRGGGRLFRFALTSGWTSGSASATILAMDGTTIESSTVEDPEGIFSSLGNTDTGLAFKQDGTYYVIQAPCPA